MRWLCSNSSFRAHIEYGDIVPLDFGGKGGEIRHPEGTQRRLSRGEFRCPHSYRPAIVDADAHEFPLGTGDLRRVLPISVTVRPTRRATRGR